MKFAVVEYVSKTGAIWRHTSERPNYLADPIKEMDPTSFGCYVSALEGEHIPLKSIIAGKESSANPLAIFIRKVIKRLSGSWPQNYSLEYFKDFNVLMVVHQISDGHEVTAFTKRLKQTYPHITILGVPTQPFGLLKQHWESHPDFLNDLKDFMASCDAFVTLVESTQSIWQQLTTTPVTYLPQPYPVEYTSQFFKSQTDKKKIIFVAGMTTRPEISRGQVVAKKLQELFPEYAIHVTDHADVDASLLEGTNFAKVPFRPWKEQLEYISEVSLVINTDYTQTRGRVQMDCAAVGTPSIGADSDGQRDVFPTLLATNNSSIEELVEQGKQLLSDSSMYNSIITTAQEKLAGYTYEVCANRLKDVVEVIKNKQE